MKVLLKRLKTIEDRIENDDGYNKTNLALLKYEKIKLLERITRYN